MLRDPHGNGTNPMRSVAAKLPRAERYTNWWDHAPRNGVDDGVGEHSSLDHMLVSPPLYRAMLSVRVDHSLPPQDYSDHWPLLAAFRIDDDLLAEPTYGFDDDAQTQPAASPPPAGCRAPAYGVNGSVAVPVGVLVPLVGFALLGGAAAAGFARARLRRSCAPGRPPTSLPRAYERQSSFPARADPKGEFALGELAGELAALYEVRLLICLRHE